MRALTLRQPYASLIMAGVKTVETRCWETSHRGPLAITASAATWDLDTENEWKHILPSLGLTEWPKGCLVGWVNLDSIHPALDLWPRVAGTPDAALGNYYPETYGWILSDPHPIEPVPVTGKLRLWTLPPELSAKLQVNGSLPSR